MTITVKTVDGTTLGTSAEISSVNRLTVNASTESNAYVFAQNTTSGETAVVNFAIDPTQTFLGLGISPVSSPDAGGCPVGSSVEVSYADDISLYVFYESTEPEPEVTIDVIIKNASGTIFASRQGISEISTIGITSSTESSQKTVTLTDVNGEVITLSWYSVEEGKTFQGLDFTPVETSNPTYPTNSGELDANWTSNTTLYEVWTTDDPDPDPDPEPEPDPDPQPDAFSIYLYKNSAENIVVDKDPMLTDGLKLDGTLREECSVVNPVITIYHEGFFEQNYAYIPKFNRYYYIDSIDSVRNNLWRLHLKVDVLMSYKADILSCGGIVGRSSNHITPELPDEEIPIGSIVKFKRIDMSTDLFAQTLTLDDYCFVLQTFDANDSTTTTEEV